MLELGDAGRPAARRGGARRARRRRSSSWSASATSPMRWRASRRAIRASPPAPTPRRRGTRSRSRLAPDAVILLKGSRGVRLERLVPVISRVGVALADRRCRPLAHALRPDHLLYYLFVPLIPTFHVLNVFTLHHLPRGRRGGDGDPAQLHRRADDPATPQRRGQLPGGARGHAGLARRQGEDADDGRADHPLLGARGHAALGAHRSATTC